MTKPETSAGVVAVVLAGSAPHDPLALQAGVAAKALVPLCGKPLGLYVLEALRASRRVSACIYVGPGTDVLDPYIDRTVPSGDRLADSLARGLEAAMDLAPRSERLLVLTADLPWLNAEALDHFVEQAPDAALVFPIIARESAEAQFPSQKRTYIALSDGTFTGGNLMLLEPRVIPKLLPLMDRAYRARKNPFALAALLGPRILTGFLTRRLALAALEQRVSGLLGAEARAFRTPHASLGVDVDKLEHLVAAQRGAALGAGD